MIIMGRINANSIVAEASAKAANITPSVLVLARMAKVTPKAMAEALSDEVENAKFSIAFTSAYVEAELAKAIDEMDKEKAKKSA